MSRTLLRRLVGKLGTVLFGPRDPDAVARRVAARDAAAMGRAKGDADVGRHHGGARHNGLGFW